MHHQQQALRNCARPPDRPDHIGALTEDVLGEVPVEKTSAERPLQFGDLMGLVRRVLYAPDGEPPPGWGYHRDGSILKQLLRRRPLADVAAAIRGLPLVCGHPKPTLRLLYHARDGIQPVFVAATQAYWKGQNARALPTP